MEERDNTVYLTGETTSETGLVELGKVLKRRFPETRLRMDVQILPDTALADHPWAVVKVCVAHIRREPTVKAEMITQAIMGAPLKILKKHRYYYYVKMEDGYLGWVSRSAVSTTTAAGYENWFGEKLGVYTEIQGFIYELPDRESYPVSDIVLGCRVLTEPFSGNWLRVSLPDGRTGYIPRTEIIPVSEFRKITPNVTKIIHLAKLLRGVSYTWGGTSTKGLDCSGFTQTVYKMNGVRLLRDANMQVTQGTEIDTSGNLGNLKPGDLVFFGANRDRITHVGIYLGDLQFIHESGMVKINSFDPRANNYSEYRTSTLQRVKRVL